MGNVGSASCHDGYTQFTEIRRVQLPENHLIGGIKTLDVLGESYLITDWRQQVFLYKEGTSELVRLNPEDCFPGFDLQPIHTFHQADSSIFLINATLPGYRFKADGSCKGSVDKDFVQVTPNRLAVDQQEKEYFYTIISYPRQSLRMRKYLQNGRLLKETELIKPPFPVFNYRFEGGGIVVQNGILYYMLPSGAKLYRYDIERDTHLENIPFVPDYKPVIDEDISADPFPSQIAKDLGEIMDYHYKVISMHKLSEKYLLIQTSFKEGEKVQYGLHLFNMETNKIEEQYAVFEHLFSFARNNKTYRIDDRQVSDENMLNPEIVVYEFNSEKHIEY